MVCLKHNIRHNWPFLVSALNPDKKCVLFFANTKIHFAAYRGIGNTNPGDGQASAVGL
jgi:hypothetical protein